MLDAAQLDEAYTHASHTMTAVGEARMPLYLARLSLLLMKDVGDLPRVKAAIEAAARDIAQESVAGEADVAVPAIGRN
jgi:hypothetical protein